MKPDKSPAQRLAERRGGAVGPSGGPRGAFSAPPRAVDAKTRALIDRAVAERKGGRR